MQLNERAKDLLEQLRRRQEDLQDLVDRPGYRSLLTLIEGIMLEAGTKLDSATEGPALYRSQGCRAGLRNLVNKVKEVVEADADDLQVMAEQMVKEE